MRNFSDYSKMTILKTCLCLTLLIVLYFVLITINEPLIDFHSFRQTQTALTSLFFLIDGYKFNYETPVGGYPWSIPFEFPIFQALVSVLSSISKSDLTLTGRSLSFIFTLLTIPVVGKICRNLKLSDSVFLIFSILFISSPLYIYWGRAFLIESTALLFTMIFLNYIIDIEMNGYSKRKLLLMFIFLLLAALQKITTILPVGLIVISYLCFRSIGFFEKTIAQNKHHYLKVMMFILIGFFVSYVWVIYTDYIKSMNLFGSELTSSALKAWNWGTFQQRIDLNVYKVVFYERISKLNLGGWIGVFLIILSLLIIRDFKFRITSLTLLFLGTLHVLLFTNLHYIHEYYQMSNSIYFILALAYSIDNLCQRKINFIAMIVLIILLVGLNLTRFYKDYYPAMNLNPNDDNSYAISKYIQSKINADDHFVAFGNDWSSSYSYFAQRKSFTVPAWFTKYNDVKSHPQNYVQKDRLKMVLSCDSSVYAYDELLLWAKKTGYSVEYKYGCIFAYRP